MRVKVRCTDSVGIKSIDCNAGNHGHGFVFLDEPYPTTYTLTYNWDTTQEANGNANIVVECYSASSERSSKTNTVLVHNIKGPAVTYQTPAANQQFLSTVASTQVKASVSKGEGANINSIQYYFDSGLKDTKTYSPAVTSTTYTHSLNLSSLSNGKHVLRIHATNTDGGITDATENIYKVDQYVVRYLAEGSTNWGFSEYISIENPNAGAIDVKLTYLTSDKGAIAGPVITMPPKSQATISPSDTVGQADFSTKVECLEGLPIAADRTMIWNLGTPNEEGHNKIAVDSPATTWYLAEGSSNWGFECWLLIQNPNAATAHCQVTYMKEGEGPQTVEHDVNANSRASFDMSKDIGAKDTSIKVTSDVPVIPERAMYRNNRREGHDSIGTTTPSTDYYLAEGATGYNVGYITYVLVQNPQNSPTNVSITYMTQNGQVAGPSFQMAANSRKTIRVNDQLPPNTDVSTHVHGSAPIIAERAMYWNNGTGEACHDSIGMSMAHKTFYLPDGQTSEGRETWTLVQNPNASDVAVEISYLTPNGQGNVVKTETIGANSRRTFNMAEHSGINGRAAIMVKSKTSGKKIMVERAMYWNSRGAGTDTIGGYGD